MTNHRDFSSRADANRFYDSIEHDHDHVSMTTNTPAPGMTRVSFGPLPKTDDESHDEFMASLRRNEQRQREEKAAAREAEVMAAARRIAAQKAAKQFGLEGREAEMFKAGFSGVSAKWANPRAEGLESIFRAGRDAWGKPEWQRQYRIAMIEASRLPPEVVFNPEQD